MKKQQILSIMSFTLLLSTPIYGMLRSSSRLALNRFYLSKSCNMLQTRCIVFDTSHKSEKMIVQEIINQKPEDSSLHESVNSLKKQTTHLSDRLSSFQEEYIDD